MSKPEQLPKKRNTVAPSPESVGFIFDKFGAVIGINPNLFAKQVKATMEICYSPQKLFYIYEKGVYRVLDEQALTARLSRMVNRFVPDSWLPSYELQYIKAIKNLVYTKHGMNPRKNVLNLKNGMLNIDDLSFHDHNPSFRSSIQLPYPYDPSAECPQFEQFLFDIFEGDPERIAIIEEWLGYSLTNETNSCKSAVLLGSGSNGKSVLCELMRQLCGPENVSSVSLSELSNSFARLDLLDKTLNLVTESEISGSTFNTEIFKALVSGDPIRVEIKHGASFSIKPTVKLVTAMNAMPFTKDQSYGLARRLLIVPFRKCFKTAEQLKKLSKQQRIDAKVGLADSRLIEKLLTELPGIFNLALKGLQRLRNNNYQFTESSLANEELKEFQDTISPISAFVSEMIQSADPESRVKNKTLCELFSCWCKDRGHKLSAEMSDIRFHALLKNALKDNHIAFNTQKSGGERFVAGIKLNDAARVTLADIPQKQ